MIHVKLEREIGPTCLFPNIALGHSSSVKGVRTWDSGEYGVEKVIVSKYWITVSVNPSLTRLRGKSDEPREAVAFHPSSPKG